MPETRWTGTPKGLKKRTEKAKADVIRALLDAGASVQPMARIPLPSLLVGYKKKNWLFYVQDPQDEVCITPDETHWVMRWRGDVEVVRSPEDALIAIGAARCQS